VLQTAGTSIAATNKIASIEHEKLSLAVKPIILNYFVSIFALHSTLFLIFFSIIFKKYMEELEQIVEVLAVLFC